MDDRGGRSYNSNTEENLNILDDMVNEPSYQIINGNPFASKPIATDNSEDCLEHTPQETQFIERQTPPQAPNRPSKPAANHRSHMPNIPSANRRVGNAEIKSNNTEISADISTNSTHNPNVAIANAQNNATLPNKQQNYRSMEPPKQNILQKLTLQDWISLILIMIFIMMLINPSSFRQ